MSVDKPHRSHFFGRKSPNQIFTVADLIQELEKQPPDTRVVGGFADPEYGEAICLAEVNGVHLQPYWERLPSDPEEGEIEVVMIQFDWSTY